MKQTMTKPTAAAATTTKEKQTKTKQKNCMCKKKSMCKLHRVMLREALGEKKGQKMV